MVPEGGSHDHRDMPPHEQRASDESHKTNVMAGMAGGYGEETAKSASEMETGAG